MGIFLQTVGISPSVFMDFPLHTMGRHCTFAGENNINITNLSKNRQPMMYHTYIEASEQSLTMLRERFTPVEEDRFIYSLQQKKWKIEDIGRFRSNLETSYVYTAKEYKCLRALSMVYNKEYPTDYAQYISTAQTLMAKMRSTLSSFKKIGDTFHPRKKRGRKMKASVSSFDRMTLYSNEYSCDCFGWEAYTDQRVRYLLSDINKYLELAVKCLDLCLQVIGEERAIRANPEKAYGLYRDSFSRSVRYNKTLITQIIQKGPFYDNALLKTFSEAEDVKHMIAELYHKLNYADFNYYCACKAVSDGRKDGLSTEETLLFGENSIARVKRIHTLFDHIAELAGKRNAVSKKTGKLSGDFVSHLLFWCGWDGRINKPLYDYIVKRCEGKVRVVQPF